jgi:hypothetical protein
MSITPRGFTLLAVLALVGAACFLIAGAPQLPGTPLAQARCNEAFPAELI